jgi:hypothetical protein
VKVYFHHFYYHPVVKRHRCCVSIHNSFFLPSRSVRTSSALRVSTKFSLLVMFSVWFCKRLFSSCSFLGLRLPGPITVDRIAIIDDANFRADRSRTRRYDHAILSNYAARRSKGTHCPNRSVRNWRTRSRRRELFNRHALQSSSSASWMVTSDDGVKFQHEIVGRHIVPVPNAKKASERALALRCHALGVRSAETIIMMERFHQCVFTTAPQKPSPPSSALVAPNSGVGMIRM